LSEFGFNEPKPSTSADRGETPGGRSRESRRRARSPRCHGALIGCRCGGGGRSSQPASVLAPNAIRNLTALHVEPPSGAKARGELKSLSPSPRRGTRTEEHTRRGRTYTHTHTHHTHTHVRPCTFLPPTSFQVHRRHRRPWR